MAFIIGTAIGSFLGVVIERSSIKGPRAKGKGLRGEGRRSRCSSCRYQLKWWENIPLISFVFLRGKCRSCRSPIPYWLPLIELAGGIGGIWVIREIGEIGIIGGFGVALIAAALIWIFFSDLAYGTVPDSAVGIGVFGVIIMSFMSHMSLMSLMVQAGAATAAAGFFLFLVFVTRGRGMGTGDVTLTAFLGFWLGWPKILLVVWVAFIFGAVAGLILIGLKLKRFGQTIPFGPFLIAAAILALMINDNWKIMIGL